MSDIRKDKKEKKPEKHRLFNLFAPSSNKKDKGVTKKQAEFDGKYNFINFFRFLRYRFGDLTIANLTFILLNFSLVLMLYSLAGTTYRDVATPSSTLYQQLYGIMQYDSVSPAVQSLTGIYGVMTSISLWTVWTRVLVYSGFTLLVTFGLSNVGMAYLTRGFVRRDYMAAWGDFWYAVKKNWKQAIPMGIIDLAVTGLIAYSLFFYRYNLTSFMMNVFFWVAIVFAFIYFMMRMYFYLIIITFDLPIHKVIKNSFIFSLLGIKRNICAVLAIAGVLFINYMLFQLLPSVGVIIPFLITISLMYFIGTYCAYPIIDKYMIKPYYSEEKHEDENVETIFKDRG